MTKPKGSNLCPWIDAFTDKHNATNTFPSCMVLADIAGDGENRLVIADFGDDYTLVKLRIYKGTKVHLEIPFSDLPCAITAIYTDFNVPHIPALAVAAGSQVFFYKNMRPFFKFCLPSDDVSLQETELWKTYAGDVPELYKLLQELSSSLGFSNLSTPSQRFLILGSDEERTEYVQKQKHAEIKKHAVIVCMASLPKSMPDEKSISCLVLATESGKVYVLDPEGFLIVKEYKLHSVALHIAVTGIFVVDYSIILAARNGRVYLIKPNETKVVTELWQYPVGVVVINETLTMAVMDNTLQSFTMKGRKQWSLELPGPPMCMSLLPLKYLSKNLIAVACQVTRVDAKSGSVLLYSGPQLVHAVNYPDPVGAILFGQFGLEEHALVSVAVRGAVSAKLLRRNATFDNSGGGVGSQTLTQDPSQIQLMIPKKSKIYMEQVLRERAECKSMHAIFQKSLLEMDVHASEVYLNALNKGSLSQKDALKVNHEVLGLGPKMKIRIILVNLSKDEILSKMGLTFIADSTVHQVQRNYIQVPPLLPGISLTLETDVLCLFAVTGDIRLLVFLEASVILTCDISMPLPESME